MLVKFTSEREEIRGNGSSKKRWWLFDFLGRCFGICAGLNLRLAAQMRRRLQRKRFKNTSYFLTYFKITSQQQQRNSKSKPDSARGKLRALTIAKFKVLFVDANCVKVSLCIYNVDEKTMMPPQSRKFVILMLLIPSMAKTIRKRQLFREQLLPNMGGKVPESAFQTDRLALNQLNARGIYSSTGVYLEHRANKEHADIRSRNPHTMQVQVPEENRFVAPAGRYHYHTPPTLDTTYVIREPVTAPIKLNGPYHQTYPVVPYTSLKLARYFTAMRNGVQNRDGPKNDIDDQDDFTTQAKKEYEPYLKKLHEVDK